MQHLYHLPQDGAVYLGSCYSNMRQSRKVRHTQNPYQSKHLDSKTTKKLSSPRRNSPSSFTCLKTSTSRYSRLAAYQWLFIPFKALPISAMPDYLHLSPSSWLRNLLRCRELNAKRSSHNCTVVKHFQVHQQLKKR